MKLPIGLLALKKKLSQKYNCSEQLNRDKYIDCRAFYYGHAWPQTVLKTKA